MKNFDSRRFLNFAKYDLVINKAFYRNLAIGTFAGTAAIVSISFMTRWSMWKMHNWEEGGLDMMDWQVNNFMDIKGSATSAFMFLLFMMVVFSGCWAHNLRNKQGRISELTLPATNLEKFTWHMGAMLVGGLLLCVASLLVCDGINYGLSSAMMSPEVTCSYTATLWEFVTMLSGEKQGGLVMFFLFSMYLVQIGLYAFGNSVKYKYNLILTFLAIQVLSYAVGIALFVLFSIFAFNFAGNENFPADENAGNTFMWIVSLILCCVAVGGVVLSYYRYKRAQITSSLNK